MLLITSVILYINVFTDYQSEFAKECLSSKVNDIQNSRCNIIFDTDNWQFWIEQKLMI